MDNNKIGKLIADLRRKQGLTQEQLGEKVGVGFRSVSKWECGKTLPDIGIINDLSKILGISSDELLSGELKSKEDTTNKKKISSKITITISILTLILIFISTIFIYEKNKTYTYKVFSAEKEEYFIDGIANIKGNNISVMISDISFKDDEFNNLMIENYEYKVTINNNFLFSYGYIEVLDYIDETMSVGDLNKNLKVNFNAETDIVKEEIIKNNLIIKFDYQTSDNQIINKEIKVILSPVEK